MDWDKLRIFHAVADAGSFTHAGETLGLSQSAVSRQISALEDSLKATLFHRHARGLLLTEQGDILYRTVREIFAKLSMVEAALMEELDVPKGPLTITTPFALGATWLTPHLEKFTETYPEIELSVLLDDQEVNLSMREADVAIRLHAPQQLDLIQRHLTLLGMHLYASKSYIEKYGKPKDAADLANHRFVLFPDHVRFPFANMNWPLDHIPNLGDHTPYSFKINNVFGAYQAVKAGIGICGLPDYMTENRPNIIRVLPEIKGPKVDAFFVYPKELRHSKRIAVFRDFLVKQLKEATFMADD